MINNHPFIDGNKRIGTLAMLAFLEILVSPPTPNDGRNRPPDGP